jgi:hypothetical protein
LNEKPGGRIGWPHHGRAWFNFWGRRLRVEWSLGQFRCGIGIEFSHDDDAVMLTLRIPLLFTLFVGLSSPPLNRLARWTGQRECSIKIHDGALWTGLWVNPWESSRRDPWYRKLRAFYPLDFILGRTKCGEPRIVDRGQRKIPMLEGEYDADITIEERTWKRARWPFVWHRSLYADVTVEKGVPVEGKGENSWDCGQDATYGMHFPCKSVSEAAAYFTSSMMKNRERYGGKNWKPREAEATT